MEVSVRQGLASQDSVALAVIGVWEDEALPANLAALLESDDFQGKSKQMVMLYPRGELPPRRIVLLGLGTREQASADTLRRAAALAAKKAHELHLTNFSMNLPELAILSVGDVAQALVEGAMLGMYTCLAYKSDITPDQSHQVEGFTLFANRADLKAAQQGAQIGAAIAQGVTLARDLANGPSNTITPLYLGETARSLGERLGLSVSVKEQEQLQTEGFGGILAVGQGSVHPPCFITMEYGAPQPGTPTICLIGKGVTFDTGGYSIKPRENMDLMKMDMSGAAAVLGAMQIVAELKLPLHVIGIVAAAENMVSNNAFKPGDIITMFNGKTVEILNTDAEGRIVLGDAVAFAQRYQPNAMIDLATLTGAIQVALGRFASGLMANNQELADRVSRAGTASAERVWQLPLWQEYRDMVKSDIADLKNIAAFKPDGGAIVGAAFIAEFAGDIPWVHLDIANTAWAEGQTNPPPYASKGATGYGVRLLIQMLRTWADEVASGDWRPS